MTIVDSAVVQRFMAGQVACWNARDRAGFLGLYRALAPDRLDIEYVGRAERQDGWFVIEDMWDRHNDQIALEVVTTIVNGNEAAVHHHNRIRSTGQVIESLETYLFSPGRLAVRYFLKPPADAGVDLAQFRGFA